MRLTLAVDTSGCAEIRRPAHFVASGRYRLQLSAAERASLQATVSDPELQSFSADAVRAAISEIAQQRAQGGTVFEVHDADRYVLELDGENGRRFVWHGLFQYAEHFPEVAALQSLKASVELLQGLSMQSRAEKQPEAQP